jgi:hypothetical protein
MPVHNSRGEQSSLFVFPRQAFLAVTSESRECLKRKTVANIRQPIRAKERADEIADLISAACEKLVELSNEWFELNDEEGLMHARRMLNAKEVTLMLSAHLESQGLAQIALNLLQTEIPMPRPYFAVRVPMLPWTLNSADTPIDAATREGDNPFTPERWIRGAR